MRKTGIPPKARVILPGNSRSLQDNISHAKALPHGNERILVIDDEPAIVCLEEEVLSSLGYHVVSKTDSLEALGLFQENPERFDLVITDMSMPSMNGDKLVQKLLELRSDIPIIMYTGSFKIIDKEW